MTTVEGPEKQRIYSVLHVTMGFNAMVYKITLEGRNVVQKSKQNINKVDPGYETMDSLLARNCFHFENWFLAC